MTGLLRDARALRWAGSTTCGLVLAAAVLLSPSTAFADETATSSAYDGGASDLSRSFADSEPLPVEQAFALTSTLLGDGSVALEWRMPPGYYLYRDRFSLQAVDAPQALGALQWSEGRLHQDPQFGEVTVFYEHARLRVPLQSGATLPQRLELKLSFQGCLENSVCYPPTLRRLSFELPPPLRTQEQASSPWLGMLLMAFAGGLLLNLMPCVLPVLSLKAFSILHAADDPVGAKRRALAYTAGVVSSFAALGGVVLALRTAGGGAGWGFHMQQPWVIGLLVLVMLAVGLGLSGVVNFGAGLAGVGQRHAQGRGLAGDFVTGVLACVVASPCTAPFMGASVAYALASPQPWAALAVFVLLGLGLAAPFLAIAFVPRAARWLPRPGAWMDSLKQWLAFPMYATAVWLLWVLGKQRGVDAMALVLLSAVVLILGLWWFEKNRFAGAGHRLLAVLIVALSLSPLTMLDARPGDAAPSVASKAELPPGAERFTPARLAELRGQGRAVFVNVTADWCLTCKVNQAAVLERDGFRALLKDADAVYLVADYTQPDEAVAALLKAQGAVGVPLYVGYDREGRRTKLPAVLSLQGISDALVQADSPASPTPGGQRG
ncbi:cytochrome C biogenesis transmembrane region family protein [Lysobacter antibioticus]|uniref:protein-disulfide reductase DsbD family protein n=1 Tax=Lysobacter antibioticus TaxID=84531 RepID=UPI000717065F|nr:protein-disulfide reductase DsbD [Lysobacter antibioticus]ALN62801.1 cytochrome C biogenesis transmembrane region family protein [Lysobacter antibioticus]